MFVPRGRDFIIFAINCINILGKPGIFDLKAKKKWEFWTNLKGTSKEECQEKYIEKIDEFLVKYKD